MPSCRAYAIAWVALVFLFTVGCEMTPRELDPQRYSDDFGEDLEVITEASVGETQMLHRRAQLELRPAVKHLGFPRAITVCTP